MALLLTIRRDLARRSAGRVETTGELIVLQPGSTSLPPGQGLPLRPVTAIGRARTNDLVLDDAFVSAEHALITRRDGRWWLRDRGSTNGSSVNDRPVTGEVELSDGDVLRIGDVRLKLKVDQ